MKAPIPLYQQIYIKLADSIYAGEFADNPKLPSLMTLCEQYGVSRITARAAVKQLCLDGFAHMKRGSVAVAASDRELLANEQYIKILKGRSATIYSMLKSDCILFPSIIVFLAHHADEAFYRDAQKIIDDFRRGGCTKRVNLIVSFFTRLGECSNNDILADMIDTKFGHMFASLITLLEHYEGCGLNVRADKFEHTLSLIREERYDELCEYARECTSNTLDNFLKIFNPDEQGDCIDDFCGWTLKRVNNYANEMFSDDLTVRIAAGFYENGKLLPSEQKLSQLYGVSLITIRKGLKKLVDIGVVNTVNGIGSYATYNLSEPVELPIERVELFTRRYAESLQLFSILLPPLVPLSFGNSDAESRSELVSRLQNMLNVEHPMYIQPAVMMLDFIVSRCGLQTVNDSLIQLEALLCRIVYYRNTYANLDCDYNDDWRGRLNDAIRSLDDCKPELFLDAIQGLIRIQFGFVRSMRALAGLEPAVDYPEESQIYKIK